MSPPSPEGPPAQAVRGDGARPRNGRPCRASGQRPRAKLSSPPRDRSSSRRAHRHRLSHRRSPRGLDEVGVMLPVTPLHHLLLRDGPALLVMTSGNRAEEPIAKDEDEAARALAGIADALLSTTAPSTRAPTTRSCAWSLARRSPSVVPAASSHRRSPWAPRVRASSRSAHTSRARYAITRGDEAYVSPAHRGSRLARGACLLRGGRSRSSPAFSASRPAIVAHDLHPEYASTRWALESGTALRGGAASPRAHRVLPRRARPDRPVIGVAFDGTGCGPRGRPLGRRVPPRRPRAVPADSVTCAPSRWREAKPPIREPWRLGVAALRRRGGLARCVRVRRTRPPRRWSSQMLDRGVSRASRRRGRAGGSTRSRRSWAFDTRSPTRVRPRSSSRRVAGGHGDAARYPFDVDARPRRPVRRRPAADGEGRRARVEPRRGATARVSARFHATLAAVVREGCRRAREEHGRANRGPFRRVLPEPAPHRECPRPARRRRVRGARPPPCPTQRRRRIARSGRRRRPPPARRRETACASASPVK